MTKQASGHRRIGGLDSKIEHWLNTIGIHSTRELVRLGSIHAYQLMRNHGFEVTLHHVYAMESAILGVREDEIPERLKRELAAAIKVERLP